MSDVAYLRMSYTYLTTKRQRASFTGFTVFPNRICFVCMHTFEKPLLIGTYIYVYNESLPMGMTFVCSGSGVSDVGTLTRFSH